MASSTNYIFKVIMGGNGGVGKSTMLYKYTKGIFMEKMSMTIGLDFFVKKLSFDSSTCTLQIWDLGGQERFRFLHDTYVNGANVGMLLFDLTSIRSLENIPYWANMFRSMDDTLPLILVGTKHDLINGNYYAGVQEAQVFRIAEMCEIKKEFYMKASSKTGLNVSNVFRLAFELAIDHSQKKKVIYTETSTSYTL